jgi:hypothetical protein
MTTDHMELPDWLPLDAWNGYVEMRKKKRAVMTPRAVGLRIKDLAAFRDNGEDIEKILDQSTANGWTDLYPLKERRTAPRQSPTFDNSRLGKHGQATANAALDWLEGK